MVGMSAGETTQKIFDACHVLQTRISFAILFPWFTTSHWFKTLELKFMSGLLYQCTNAAGLTVIFISDTFLLKMCI